MSVVSLFLFFFQKSNFFGGTFLFGLCLDGLQLFVLFVGESLPVNVDVLYFFRLFACADNLFQGFEIGKFDVVQFQQIVVVEVFVVETVAHNTVGVGSLQLLKHTVDVVLTHVGTFYRNYGAIIQKFSHYLAVVACVACFCRKPACFRHHFQCSVGGEIENETTFFHLAVDVCGGLNTENRLQIT